MHMDKQITQSILVTLCSMRGTKIAEVEGLWLVNRPKHSVSEDPDNSPEVQLCSPFIVPSSIAQEILVMSFHDVTVICFDLPAGKPLCMHIRNIAVHLCIHQHPHQNTKYYKCIHTSPSFPEPNFCVTGLKFRLWKR